MFFKSKFQNPNIKKISKSKTQIFDFSHLDLINCEAITGSEATGLI
jgi:hypothetical protein